MEGAERAAVELDDGNQHGAEEAGKSEPRKEEALGAEDAGERAPHGEGALGAEEAGERTPHGEWAIGAEETGEREPQEKEALGAEEAGERESQEKEALGAEEAGERVPHGERALGAAEASERELQEALGAEEVGERAPHGEGALGAEEAGEREPQEKGALGAEEAGEREPQEKEALGAEEAGERESQEKEALGAEEAGEREPQEKGALGAEEAGEREPQEKEALGAEEAGERESQEKEALGAEEAGEREPQEKEALGAEAAGERAPHGEGALGADEAGEEDGKDDLHSEDKARSGPWLPQRASNRAPDEAAEAAPKSRAVALVALARKLKVALPKKQPDQAEYLTFQSWWVEKSTKRVVEVALELATERFRVTLDKEVHFLSSELLYTHRTESFLPTVLKDTKILECHLHEKFSDNQHALSLELPHLQCWDLHVGAKINLFGRPTTLMACDLRTGAWLEYHAQGLRAIKEAIELALRKYEQVPFKSSLRDTRGVNKVKREWEQGATLPSQFRARGPFLPATTDRGARGAPGHILGGDDLRTMLRQAHTLRERLAAYRPKLGAEFTQLISQFSAQFAPADSVSLGHVH